MNKQQIRNALAAYKDGIRRQAHKRRARSESRHIAPPPSTCAHCGTDRAKLEKHHFSYAKPAEVEWLCKKCHTRADEMRRIYESLDLAPLPLGPDQSAVIPLDQLANPYVLASFGLKISRLFSDT